MQWNLNKLLLFIFCFAFAVEAEFVSLMGRSSSSNKNFCMFCQMLSIRFRIRLTASPTNEELVSMIREHCLLISPTDLCHKLLDEFGDQIVSTVRVLLQNHSDVCGQFVLGCTHDKSHINHLWSLPLPQMIEMEQTRQSNEGDEHKKEYKILHLTDPHIDFDYAEGSEADCQTDETLGHIRLCCRNDSSSSSELKVPAGKWGMPMHCDPPYRLFENALSYIRNNVGKIDYIILTGDYDVHTVWNGNHSRIINSFKNITNTIQSYLPDIPLYVTIGNHEGDPSDSFPSAQSSLLANISTSARDGIYETLQLIMNPLLPQNASESILKTGSYSIRPFPGLKLIFINNNYCSHLNFLIYTDLVDPDGVLQWLIQELSQSENALEKVHIIGHIPPVDNCLRGWANMFLKIVKRFSKIIEGEFYGHTHHDQFTVYRDGNESFGSAFISPSFSTFPGQSPAFRTYTMNEKFKIEDIETYTTDIMKANLMSMEPLWIKEYNFKKVYNLNDLEKTSLHKLTQNLKNSIYFERFEYLYWKNWKNMCSTTSCRNKIRNQLILTIK